MRITLTKEGLLDPQKLQAWTYAQAARIRAGTAVGMKESGAVVAQKVQTHVSTALKVKRRGFLKSFGSKVYVTPGRMPVLYIGSRIPFAGMHEFGGTIRGPLLIPLLETRMGYVAFKKVVDTIIRTGAGFFKRMDDGRVILFAEYQPSYGRPLARFRRAERARREGPVRKGEDIPIAVLVPQVRLQQRLRVRDTVKSNLRYIAESIERGIAAAPARA